MSNSVSARSCAEITPAQLEWLWKPILARGKLAVLDGDPGTGKSFLAVDLAARLSRGGPLPDGQSLARPHTTILLNAEDDPADTVRPRVLSAGADPARVFAAGGPNEALPPLPGGIADYTRLVHEHKADLLVIDPLAAFLPRSIANNPLRVRDALGPLTALAADTGCAVLILRHRSGPAGPGGTYRGASAGILGLARTGLLLARHPDDPELRVLAMSKTNLGAVAGSLGFRLPASDSGAAIQWTGPVDLSAEELCGVTAAQVSRRPRERAMQFLCEALANGPLATSEVEKRAAERGLSWKTVLRAKEELRLKSEQIRATGNEQVWQWFDPKQRAAEARRDQAELADVEHRLLAGLRRRTGADLTG